MRYWEAIQYMDRCSASIEVCVSITKIIRKKIYYFLVDLKAHQSQLPTKA